VNPRPFDALVLLRGFVCSFLIALGVPPQPGKGVRESGWRRGRGERLAKIVQGHWVSIVAIKMSPRLCYLPPPSIRGDSMKQTRGIELPASFVVTVSHAGTEILQAAPVDSDILTVAKVAELLKCKPSSIYN
jgi:hypothetical protein